MGLLLLSTVAAADGSSERLLFHGPDSLKQLDSSVAGSGIAGTSAAELAGKDGRVVWKVYRDETDELGMRHVFYRQHLMPAGDLAEVLGEPWASDGIPVLGGEVGVHTLADGTPRAVFGRQYREVSVPAAPTVVTAAQAFAVAHHGAGSIPGFAAPDLGRWPMAWRETAAALPRLRFVADQQASLRLVWEVATVDGKAKAYSLFVDAVTAALVDARPQVHDAVCSVSNPATQVPAVAYGQLGTSRWLRASPVGDRPGWTHEAYEPEIDGYRPSTTVLMGTGPNESGYKCPDQKYGVMPLISQGGAPRYDDYGPPTAPRAIAGRTAADALHHTLVVMSTLKDQFGRAGSSGASSKVADVVVEQQMYDGDVDTAHYVRDWTVECRAGGLAPCSSVTVSPRSGSPRTAAASLDVMGHEWGHGVVEFAASNFEGSPVGDQLHEAFANVLGHAVEWLNQGSGNWYEQADWCFGEDHLTSYWPWGATCPSYWSRADWFLPVVTHTFGTSYWSYHREHGPGNANDPHVKGHMLTVVHYLLSVGGKNPICPAAGRGGVPGPWVATSCHDVNGVGVEKASKILMRVLTVYATSNLQWADLPVLAKYAAFDLYHRCWQGACGYPAPWEQLGVRQAFAAIGYDDATGSEDCGRCP